jgi:hypothetical protein
VSINTKGELNPYIKSKELVVGRPVKGKGL